MTLTDFGKFLALTVIFEIIAAFFLKIRRPRDYLLIVLVNIVTNPLLNLVIAFLLLWKINPWIILVITYVLLEPLVIFIECVYYRKWLSDGAHALRYSIILNLVSVAGGLLCQQFFF